MNDIIISIGLKGMAEKTTIVISAADYEKAESVALGRTIKNIITRLSQPVDKETGDIITS